MYTARKSKREKGSESTGETKGHGVGDRERERKRKRYTYGSMYFYVCVVRLSPHVWLH